MPFTATNADRTKPLEQGVEFPITVGGRTVAVLVAEDDDRVHVTLVNHAVVLIRNGMPNLTSGSTTVDA